MSYSDQSENIDWRQWG